MGFDGIVAHQHLHSVNL